MDYSAFALHLSLAQIEVNAAQVCGIPTLPGMLEIRFSLSRPQTKQRCNAGVGIDFISALVRHTERSRQNMQTKSDQKEGPQIPEPEVDNVKVVQ
jgi:hypothetical protein